MELSSQEQASSLAATLVFVACVTIDFLRVTSMCYQKISLIYHVFLIPPFWTLEYSLPLTTLNQVE